MSTDQLKFRRMDFHWFHEKQFSETKLKVHTWQYVVVPQLAKLSLDEMKVARKRWL